MRIKSSLWVLKECFIGRVTIYSSLLRTVLVYANVLAWVLISFPFILSGVLVWAISYMVNICIDEELVFENSNRLEMKILVKLILMSRFTTPPSIFMSISIFIWGVVVTMFLEEKWRFKKKKDFAQGVVKFSF